MGTYATAAKIKERCRIETADTAHDTELANAVIYGDLFVTRFLGQYGLSVTSGNAEMSDVASDYGAYYFLRNRNPDFADRYRRDAVEWLNMYVFNNTGIVMRTRGPPVPKDLELSEI